MKPTIVLAAAFIVMCMQAIPSFIFAQAKINGGSAYFDAPAVPFSFWTVGGTNEPLSMENFADNKTYRIEIVQNPPLLANNLSASVGSWGTIASNTDFTWHDGDKFSVNYVIYPGTPTNQTQVINFRIYRKIGAYYYQSTFNYYITTTCSESFTFGSNPTPVPAGDYEVTGNLTVANKVNPNGGLAQFDAGQWVAWTPGFQSDLSAGGVITAVIDGCGGALKPASPDGAEEPPPIALSDGTTMVVYPNPAGDQCTFRIPGVADGNLLSVRLFDLKGASVYSQNRIYQEGVMLDLSALNTGIYLLQVRHGQLSYTGKIIKK